MSQVTKESASAEQECRAAFEEYITAKYCAIYLEVDQHNEYVSAEVTGRWQAFQAAWNRRTPRAESDMSGVDLSTLKSEAYCFGEWIRKTNWVQDQISTFPVQALGKHRADVMREEIERLRTLIAGFQGAA